MGGWLLWRSTGLDSFLGSETPNILCFVGLEAESDKSQAELDQLQDEQKDQGEELVEVYLAVPWEEPRPIFINANLSNKLKQELFDLSRELKDTFASTYAQMIGFGPQLVTHKLNIREWSKSTRQAPKNFKQELEVQIKQFSNFRCWFLSSPSSPDLVDQYSPYEVQKRTNQMLHRLSQPC